jgi:tRNA 5-methylaminomethyl-2-thiouridine biosynthesis bifunctional protein
MIGAPRSEIYDDVYFSAENGLAETHHVFLQGNNLPAAWQALDYPDFRFTIAETGFGTGLNFLSVWKLFEETAPKESQLDFISFEKFPLKPEQIREALKPFAEELGPYLEKYLAQYPILVPGYHRLDFGRVRLTLIFDEINEAIAGCSAKVDTWFLDGFTPSKNPDMWTDMVFKNMARMSNAGATFATFTAAGFVKRGLKEAGFDVQKTDGFASKRDMLVGSIPGERVIPKITRGRVAIIGGGLAGTSLAYVLKNRGLTPVIYEAGETLAAGASGSTLGLYNPRFCAHRNGDSDFYTASYAHCIRTIKSMADVDYNPVGALHLINAPEKEKRFSALLENWGWSSDHMRRVDAAEASNIAGIAMDKDALYLPDGGYVSPYKLCRAYAKDVEIHLNHKVENLDELNADFIVLAGGAPMKEFVPWLPIHSVRGQVTTIEGSDVLKDMRCNIHYGGYISAACEGKHKIGATFQKWLEHTNLLEEDAQDNIARLRENVPALADADMKVTEGWAALRTSSQDRFPVAGKVPGMDNVYISTAHASHGIVSSLASAHLVADMLCETPKNLPPLSVEMLDAQRFIDRAQRKGQIL